MVKINKKIAALFSPLFVKTQKSDVKMKFFKNSNFIIQCFGLMSGDWSLLIRTKLTLKQTLKYKNGAILTLNYIHDEFILVKNAYPVKPFLLQIFII